MIENKELNRLVKRAMKNDQEAIGRLAKLYGKTILYHVHALVHNKEEVEDAVQEVVIRMAASIGRLSSPYAFSSWMKSLIVRTCIDYERKTLRYDKQVIALEPEDDFVDEDVNNQPEEVASNKDSREQLLGYIGLLPDAQRLALLMYYYDELSYKEIAIELDVEVGTVSRYISDGKKKLAAMLTRNDTSSAPAKAMAGAALGGSSLDLAIAEAFRYQEGLLVSAQELEKFNVLCDKVLLQHPGPAVSTTAQSGLLAKGLIALLVFVVVLVGGVAGAQLYKGTSVGGASKAADGAAVSTPEISIEFRGEHEVTSINPSQMQLITEDAEGTILGWSIIDEQGVQVVAGNGATVSDELRALPDGEFTVLWQFEDVKGVISTAARVFFIQR